MSRKPSKAELFIEDMKRCRGIDFARIGMQVEVDGHLGTIVGMNRSANLDVVMVNQLKFGSGSRNCHPTWETRYFDADGKVIADYRKAAEPAAKPPKASGPLTSCAAARDGDCTHAQCPQLRDNEPHVSGRHCPLDCHGDDD